MLSDNFDEDEVSRSYQLGKKALSQIKTVNAPADPSFYELWYTYVSGQNTEMNRMINNYISSTGKLTAQQHGEIRETFLSHTNLAEKTEQISEGISGLTEEILANITRSLNDTSRFSDNLVEVSSDLEKASSTSEIESIVTALLATTKDMEQRNRDLESQLHSSRERIDELNTNLEDIRKESLTDALTTLGNRKLFDGTIKKLIERADKDRDIFSLLITDVDYFKKFNDTHGHLTGDQVLRLVGQVTRQNVKGRDVPCRYGGEEFGVLLPGTRLKEAIKVAENIRLAVMNKELVKKTTGENLGRVTISIGVVEYRSKDDPNSMIARADTCLYSAKHQGRNRVISENELSDEEMKNLLVGI